MDRRHSGRIWKYRVRIPELSHLTSLANNFSAGQSGLALPKVDSLAFCFPHICQSSIWDHRPSFFLGWNTSFIPPLLTWTSPITGFHSHRSQAPASAARSQSASSGSSCVHVDLRQMRQILAGALGSFELSVFSPMALTLLAYSAATALQRNPDHFNEAFTTASRS